MNLEKINKDDLEQLFSLLNKMLGEEDNEKLGKKRKEWTPETGEEYWTFSQLGDLIKSSCENGMIDSKRHRVGWMFRTKEDAEFAIERQKIVTELRRYAFEHNDFETENWDGDHAFYTIVYNVSNRNIDVASTCLVKDMLSIYFSSERIARDAMSEVGEERIIKYLFDVEIYDGSEPDEYDGIDDDDY